MNFFSSKKLREFFLYFLFFIFFLAGCGGGNDYRATANSPSTQLLSVQALASSSYTNAVQQLYIAYFGRPADTDGLRNFEKQLAALGAPNDVTGLAQSYNDNVAIKSLIDSFGLSEESAALYSGGNTEFVTGIYNNLLNRAPDPSGMAFWVNALDSGVLTKANASLSIMAGALANTSEQGQADAALINRKVAIGSNFTTALANAPVNGYAGKVAAAQARAMLASISAITDVELFQNTVNTLVSNLASSSNTVFDEVKVMFCDCSNFDESSTIQNAPAWYISSPSDKATTKAMVAAGWSIQSVFNLNAKQFYLVFVKNSQRITPISDVKIMFCDCENLHENSIVQNAFNWYVSSALGKTTTKELVQEGWSVQNVFNLNTKQFYLVFVKNAPATQPVSDVKIMFCDCSNFDENKTIQNATEWYFSLPTGKTTTKDMVREGWSILSAFNLNTKQFYLVFSKPTVQIEPITDAKIMFCDCSNFDENSTIQGAPEWYVSSPLGKTTAKELVKEGWSVQSAFNLNIKQFYIIFVKKVQQKNASKDVKIMFCDCSNFDESSTIQNAPQWYVSSSIDKSTTKEMLNFGWSVSSVFNLNAKKFYIVFDKK